VTPVDTSKEKTKFIFKLHHYKESLNDFIFAIDMQLHAMQRAKTGPYKNIDEQFKIWYSKGTLSAYREFKNI